MIDKNSIVKFILDINKWQNIQYDFSGQTNNSTLNVLFAHPVS